MNYLNFETEKWLVQNPTLSNAIILFVIICVAVATVARKKNNFLDRTQTDQLKGVAILLVVTGHLWSHVSLNNAVPNFAGYAVALFLILSGYGLTRSWQMGALTAREFVGRRIARVMIPYWIATICILVLDVWLLGRKYSIFEVAFTFLGANFSQSLRYLDYARWYITLILIFYCVFFLVNKFFRTSWAVFFLFVFSLFLFVLRRIELFPFGSLFHFIAFPLGCLIACFYRQLTDFLTDSKLPLILIAFVAFLSAILCAVVNPELNENGILSKVFNLLFGNIQPFFLCIVLVCIFGLLGIANICSRFLMFCGIISYEVYLLHGPFLIKYNPVFTFFSSDYIVVAYIVFLLFILILSSLFKLFHEYMFNSFGKLSSFFLNSRQ